MSIFRKKSVGSSNRIIVVPIEISARHAHLAAEDWVKLFSTDGPTVKRSISQPPQFIAAERLTIVGPSGQFDQVGIIGPLRPHTQVELALTDARKLGLKPPLSDSGQLAEASQITLTSPTGSIQSAAAIIQRRHIHANPADAKKYGLHDGQEVSVKINSPRGGMFDHVLVRVHANFVWRMHIDTDEGNALGVGPATTGEVIIA